MVRGLKKFGKHWHTVRFVMFWQKEIGAKAARKMLVKLTAGALQTTNGEEGIQWIPCEEIEGEKLAEKANLMLWGFVDQMKEHIINKR